MYLLLTAIVNKEEFMELTDPMAFEREPRNFPERVILIDLGR